MKTSERRLHLLAVHAVLQEISRTRGDASVAFDFHEEGDYFLDTLPNRSTQSAVAEAAAPSPATRTPSINTNMNGLSETSDLSAQEEDEPCAVSITSHINCSAGSKKEHETSGSSQREQKQESSHDEVKSSAAAASVEGNFHLPSTASVASQQSSLHTSPSQVPHTALPRVRNLFAVVCDTSASGKREYPWGALDIYDEERSDTRRLQRLLFESDNITSMRATVQEMSVCMFQREKEAREQALANEAAAEHATAALEKRWRGVWGISPYVEYTVHVVIQALLGLTRLLLVALLLILVSLLLRMHA